MSSQIASIGHERSQEWPESDGVLEVEFNGGTVYRYSGVPHSVFQRLMDANKDKELSVGSVFHSAVKTAKDKDGNPLYPHMKMPKENQ